MLRRQESSLSTSSRRHAALPESHFAESIGCMFSILHFFSKKNNSSSKRLLTFGRKKDGGIKFFDEGEMGCGERKWGNEMRSPTIPAEIRRSDAMTTPSSSYSFVAKLMGLNENDVVEPTVRRVDPSEEKRRQLQQALEKCNKDLEALKRIITAVQTMELSRTRMETPPCMEKFVVATQPSKSPPEFIPTSNKQGTLTSSHQPVPEVAMKLIEKDDINNKLESKPATDRWVTVSPLQSNTGKARSVEEAFDVVFPGQKKEEGRIGLALHEFVWKELVEELVNELNCPVFHSLPRGACRKRLSF